MFNIVLFVVYILLFVVWFRIGIFGLFVIRIILIDDGFASFMIELILVVGLCFAFHVRILLLVDAVIRFNDLHLIGLTRNGLLFSFMSQI